MSAAYLGSAGFNFSGLLKIIANSNSSAERAEKKTFVVFMQNVNARLHDGEDTLQRVKTAYEWLEKIANKNRSVRINQGVVNVFRSVITIALFAKIEGFDKKDQFAVDDLKASSCAMDFIVDNALSASSKCTSVTKGAVVTINGQNYTPLRIDVTGSVYNDFYKLANASGSDVIMTKGACSDGKHDDERCIDVSGNGAGPWVPTPVLDGNVTMSDALIGTINKGIDTIQDEASDDVKEDIENYRNEMDTNGDGHINAEEMSAYIQNKL